MEMKEYKSKEEFYEHYGHLSRGWGNLDHTSVPGGWDIHRLEDVKSDSAAPASPDPETWLITVVAPSPEIDRLDYPESPFNQDPVPGVVIASSRRTDSRRTDRVRVLVAAQDLRPAYAVLEEISRDSRTYSLEELAGAVRAPYSR